MHPAAESVLSGAGCAAAAEDRERACLAAAREQEEAAMGPAAPEDGSRREGAGQGGSSVQEKGKRVDETL